MAGKASGSRFGLSMSTGVPFKFSKPLLRGERNSYAEKRTLPDVALCRKLPVMSLDDGTGDGQSHAHSVGLCGVKRLEYLAELLGGNTGTGINHFNLSKFPIPRCTQ